MSLRRKYLTLGSVTLVAAILIFIFRNSLTHYLPGVLILRHSLTYYVLGVLVIFLLLWFIPKRQVVKAKTNPETKGPLELENDYRQTLVQVFGGVAILVTLYAAFENAKLAQETLALSARSYELTRRGQVSDRAFKAMDMLSREKNMDAKVAAIYSLEQVADEDPQSEWLITGTLFNYARAHQKWSADSRRKPEDPVPPDISAILDFLRRRPWKIKTLDGKEECVEYHQCIDYQKGERPDHDDPDYFKIVNLPYVDFRNAFLERAMLKMLIIHDAHLERARFCKGHFEGAYAANSNFMNADLSNSYWNTANLHDADLSCSHWSGADMDGAYLKGAKLFGTDLTGVRHLRKQQLEMAEGDGYTKLSDESLRPSSWGRNPRVKCEIKVRCNE